MIFDKRSLSIYQIFGLIIVIAILLSGILLIFSKYFEYIPENYRFILGFLIISYGAFRLVNIYIKLKDNNYENEID